MQTPLSRKGQVVFPNAIGRQLGLRTYDSLDASVKGRNTILAPRDTRRARAVLRRDAISGLPVLSAGQGVAQLTSEQVQVILSGLLP